MLAPTSPEGGGGLEQRDAVFGMRECVCRGKAAEACASAPTMKMLRGRTTQAP